MPSSAGEDGTDGLGTVPSVLQILRTEGTVDNTAFWICFRAGESLKESKSDSYGFPMAQRNTTKVIWQS